MNKIMYIFGVLFFCGAVNANEIDIAGIDKKTLLCALYEKAIPQGYQTPKSLNNDTSGLDGIELIPIIHQKISDQLDNITCEFVRDEFKWKVNKLRGRNLDVDLSGDTFNPSVYDEHNGKDMAQIIVNDLKQKMMQESGELTDEQHEKFMTEVW
jgi:hypothetical protein